MKFNSKSVLMRGGKSYHFPVKIPSTFINYDFAPNVLKNAVEEFNKKLNSRPNVTVRINEVDLDLLSMSLSSVNTFSLWTVVKNEDKHILESTIFNMTGNVYFKEDSDVDVDYVVIDDVIYGNHQTILGVN